MKKLDAFSMDIFGAVKHDDENFDLAENFDLSDSQALLDYMALVVCRRLQLPKAFKGGYLLNQILGEQSRMTHDIDFSISDEQGYEAVKQVLTEIGDALINRGVIESYKVKPTISSTSSGGIDFYNAQGAKILGVDVGLHSLQWGVTSYDFNFAIANGFCIERMLSDKLIAILSRKRFRRTKDLYDFWVITNNFDFDYDTLRDFIERRGGAEWQNIPFDETILLEYAKAWDKLVLQTPTHGTLEKPLFRVALERFYEIALPMKEQAVYTRWSHTELRLKE